MVWGLAKTVLLVIIGKLVIADFLAGMGWVGINGVEDFM